MAMRPATARGGARGQSPQRDPELMGRLKELETAQKNEERQKKLAERKRAQELREAKKKLSRELQAAQRSLTKSEQEVSKLNGQLARTEQQAQQATVKKTREGEKHEEGIGRIRQKHGKVGGVLREKMANVGQARGRLAHVQFALSMLEKGVIIQVGQDETLPQPESATGPPQTRRRRRVSVGIGEVEEEYEEETAEEGGNTEEEIMTADIREEFEQLKEENRRLREHLADSDQRCYTAVQLLQQAQDVLEQRSDVETSGSGKLKLRLEEKPLEMTMETASTMHSSREESAQPSPTAPLELPRAVQTQPALQVTAPNLPMAPMGPDGLPNLLAGQRPTEKRIFYAGSTMGPNRMVSGPPMMPPPFGYQPMQLPQDHTMPLGATLLASASSPAIRPMGKMPLGQEPVAVPHMRQPVAEPIMPLR